METIENPTVTFVRLALDVICEAERRLRIKGEKWFLGSSRWFFTSACCFGGRCNLRTPALIDWNIEALKVTPSSSFLIKFQLLFFPRMKMCDLRRVERILWRPLAWLSQTSLTSLSLSLSVRIKPPEGVLQEKRSLQHWSSGWMWICCEAGVMELIQREQHIALRFCVEKALFWWAVETPMRNRERWSHRRQTGIIRQVWAWIHSVIVGCPLSSCIVFSLHLWSIIGGIQCCDRSHELKCFWLVGICWWPFWFLWWKSPNAD